MIKRLKRYLSRKIRKIQLIRNYHCKIGANVIFDEKCWFEGYNLLSKGTRLYNCSLGIGTYTNNDAELFDVKIGRFCSIAKGVSIISGAHPTKQFVSIHPAFYSSAKQTGFSFVQNTIFEERKYSDPINKYAVEIGNDVWIGTNALILGGIHIHDGAIIAAGAVVTKDVPPYAIVGGVPARVIKYRFTEEQISFLLQNDLWNKEFWWYQENADLFSDIQTFMERYSNKKL